MNDDKIGIYKTMRNGDSLKKTMDIIFDEFNTNKRFDNVLIKPNLCYYWKSASGYTTDPILVSSIIDKVREVYEDVNISIIESDASAMRTKYVYKMLDYEKIAREKKVELINLSKLESKKIHMTINNVELKYKVPKLLLKENLLINVPKFKVMKETYITCALKNMFGCLSVPRKIQYHKVLNEIIISVNKAIKTDLVIVDGLVALANKPFKMNMIMAGKNPYYIDWISAKMMGYNPGQIKFLKIGAKENLGQVKNINLIGDSMNDFSFPKVNNMISKNSFKILLKMLNLYATIVGDVIPPMLEVL